MASRLVSIIVLNYNGEKIIQQCLDCLLKQTYPSFEIIVVDNHSSDGSLVLLEEYLITGKVSVVRSRKNLGVPGGRNLGLLYAKGEIIAFIDNDGYADENWLKEAVQTLGSDEKVGAVASTVFFSNRKIILNGAGGTMNRRGYGWDHCFNLPYEFAEIPHEVLYPMGCGMVIWRSMMERIGPFDALLFNYYDDAELGIRIWKSGFRVVVSPYAWIDHEWSYSDQFHKNKAFLCERNRIRTVLKYYPPMSLFSWFFHEWRLLKCVVVAPLRGILLKSLAWNLAHLPSTLKWRFKFAFHDDSFWPLLHPSRGSSHSYPPNNQAFRPDPTRAGSRLILDVDAASPKLNYGWYWVEKDCGISFRWTGAQASAFFRFSSPVKTCSIKFRFEQVWQQARIVLRRFGELDSAWEIPLSASSPSWQEMSRPCNVEPGMWELLLLTERTFRGPSGRELGIAVSSIEFE